MQRSPIVFLMLFFPFLLMGQFVDDFSDGNFSSDPPWIGDVDKFVVEHQVLRLMDEAAGTAWLATQSSVMADTQWEFWVRLAFTPSNNNHPRIYLASDSQDLNGSLNGYFLRIGKDGTDNKRLYFYRQDGESITGLMEGSMNIASGSNNLMRFRITRDAAGNWDFWADPTGGQLYLPQGSLFDNVHTSTSWFGIKCLYTISNSDRFYFDDFYVGEIIPDTVPPGISYINVVSSSALDVYFDKAVEPFTAGRVTNYFVNPAMGAPLVAGRNPMQPNLVNLIFSEPFTQDLLYELHVMNVEDYSGNVMEPFIGEFAYYVPRRFDVVFNELMADPTPEVGLPPYEYIELFNTSGFTINLEGWVLQHANTFREIPFAEIPAGGYLLLTTEAAYPFLEEYGNAVAVPGLSATALTNAGTTLLLFDAGGNLVSFVSYTDEWYGDPAKAGGGWSLEKIDPYNFCQGKENWKASVDLRGGTPGETNSVKGDNHDYTPPDLLRAGFENPNLITLFFSEPMDEASLLSPESYSLEQLRPVGAKTNKKSAEVQVPVEVVPLLPDFSRVNLRFDNPLEPGLWYEVKAGESLADCAGNTLNRKKARVAAPQPAATLDVVINEVLFNPPDRGVRYLELYNRSSKVIDLKDHFIASKDTIENSLVTLREISPESHLMFPGDFVVVTPNPGVVKNQYMTNNPEGFIRTDGFPSMTNTSGVVVFASKSLQIIHQFVYHEDMHFALLTSKKGVALERLNPEWPTQDRNNWHSAAQNVGFGTPAYRNSQYTIQPDSPEYVVEVFPEVFSPDGDGHNDLLMISYVFDEPGFVANVNIFDSRGRLMRRLVNGELLATRGVITWDGTTDDFQKAPIGIYVIHLEIFDLNGRVKNYRRTAVLGGRL